MEKVLRLQTPPVAGGVHVYTVATSYKIGLHNLLASLDHHHFTYSVLEFGQKWKGWRGRMQAYRDAATAHAAAYGSTSLLVFIDAYDALCIRDADSLATVFASFGKPMLVGLEAGCSPHNCGHIEAYWSATRGEPPDRPNKYANGGFVMGTAEAIAEAYDWILAAGHDNDQVGLADFVSKHPMLVAADELSRIICNRYWLEGTSGREDAGMGAYFVHYAGLKDMQPLFNYNDDVTKFVGPLGLVATDIGDPKKLTKIVAVSLLVILVSLVFTLGYRIGRR